MNGPKTICCKANGQFLDAGPQHMWRHSVESNPNPKYCVWKLIPNGDSFYIQSFQNGGFLNGGPKHIWSQSTESKPHPNMENLRWKLIPADNEAYYIECHAGGYLDGGPKHIWGHSKDSNPNSNFIKWTIQPFDKF